MCAYQCMAVPAPWWVSGQFRIGMVGKEAVGGVIVDERVVLEPLHGAALGPGVSEGVPRRKQVGVFLMELVLGAAEGAPSLDCSGEATGWGLVRDPAREGRAVRV